MIQRKQERALVLAFDPNISPCIEVIGLQWSLLTEYIILFENEQDETFRYVKTVYVGSNISVKMSYTPPYASCMGNIWEELNFNISIDQQEVKNRLIERCDQILDDYILLHEMK